MRKWLLSFGSLFCILASSPASADVFIGDSGLAYAKGDLDNPQRVDAYAQVKALADEALANTATISVVNQGPAWKSPHHLNAAIDLNQAAKPAARYARALAIMYRLTGDKRYADRAVKIFYDWAVNPATYMAPETNATRNPDGTCCTRVPDGFDITTLLYIGVTMPGLIYAADLLDDYPGWPADQKAAFKQWARKLAVDFKTYQEGVGANVWIWRILLIGSVGGYLNDTELKNYAFDFYRQRILPKVIGRQGEMVNEIKRSTDPTLYYSMYSVNALMQVAEIAWNNGVDLYNYKAPDGQSLKKALDFHAPFITGQKPWPYPDRDVNMGRGNEDTLSTYELAFARFPEPIYEKVVLARKRPRNFNSGGLGPVTLTHYHGNGAGPAPSSGGGSSSGASGSSTSGSGSTSGGGSSTSSSSGSSSSGSSTSSGSSGGSSSGLGVPCTDGAAPPSTSMFNPKPTVCKPPEPGSSSGAIPLPGGSSGGGTPSGCVEAEAFLETGGTQGAYQGHRGVEIKDGTPRYVYSFDTEDWIKYRLNFGGGANTLRLVASVRPAYGTLIVHLGSPTGTIIASQKLQPTKAASRDPNVFKDIDIPIQSLSGAQDVYLSAGPVLFGIAEIDKVCVVNQ